MQDAPKVQTQNITPNAVCNICRDIEHGIWGRTYDDKGRHIVVCRLCWESQYPCDQSANFVKIPYRIKAVFGWALTTPVTSITIMPGEFEIGVIDSYTDAITLWIYSDELKVVKRDTPAFLPNTALNNIQQELLKSSCSCEAGYIPVLTLYSFLKRYAIFYKKDAHIRKCGF
jgi:hypothetical protein